MDATDDEQFDTVLNRSYVPTKLAGMIEDSNKTVIKARMEWPDNEKKLVALDTYSQTLVKELFETVANCTTTKEVWDTLLIMKE